MKRSNELLKKRETFVINYINNNSNKQMKTIILELSEMLFLSERTIYMIYAKYHNNKKDESHYGKLIMELIRSKFTGSINENDSKEGDGFSDEYQLKVTWNNHKKLQYYELIYNGHFLVWFNYSNETNSFIEKIPNVHPNVVKSMKNLYNEIFQINFI